MSIAHFRELVRTEGLVGLTLEQYERMIEQGILPEGEPIELLDGFLFRKDRAKAGEDPMTVGYEHAYVVQRLMALNAMVPAHGCHFRCQLPIALPPDGAPEPDGAIVRGRPEDYRDHHPTAGDTPCVIEVADNSLQRDRVTKLRIYADGGISQYVIINLVERVVEVYEHPLCGRGRYESSRRLEPSQSVRFSCAEGAGIEVPVASLLP